MAEVETPMPAAIRWRLQLQTETLMEALWKLMAGGGCSIIVRQADEYARQAMVAPIEVAVTPGAGGKVVITEGEYTPEGFETSGLRSVQEVSCRYCIAFHIPTVCISDLSRHELFIPLILSLHM